jgi:hypothetical protein
MKNRKCKKKKKKEQKKVGFGGGFQFARSSKEKNL